MGQLDSRVSVVGGDTAAGKISNSSAPRNDAAESYRTRLRPLRRQVDDLNREIQQMRSAKGSVRENIESQVQIRDAKRAKLQEQINEIEEEARRHGIEPGQLR
jgi:chromosome segregation ATPase